jgi:hypothetical protein
VDYVITAAVQRPRTRDASLPAVTAVTLKGGFRQDINSVPTSIGGWSQSAQFEPGKTALINLMGAEIEILDVSEDNTIRFRVLKPTPAQVQRITMGVTTRTTVVPIFIPG